MIQFRSDGPSNDIQALFALKTDEIRQNMHRFEPGYGRDFFLLRIRYENLTGNLYNPRIRVGYSNLYALSENSSIGWWNEISSWCRHSYSGNAHAKWVFEIFNYIHS